MTYAWGPPRARNATLHSILKDPKPFVCKRFFGSIGRLHSYSLRVTDRLLHFFNKVYGEYTTENAPLKRRVSAFLGVLAEYLVYDAIFLGFVCGEEEIAVDIRLDLFQRLARALGEELVEAFAQAEDMLGGYGDI